VFARLLATFALVIGTVSAGSTDTDLVVYLKTAANQPAAPLNHMKRELATLMKTAGYRVQWGDESADSVLAVVELNGTCTMPAGFDAASGSDTGASLATTNVTDGQVLPFSAVNCAALTRSLAPALLKDAGTQRDFLYGRALARVVAHELYHILMRTTEHARSGIARSCFSTEDLLTERFDFEGAVLAQMRRKPDGSSAIAFTEDSDR